MLPIASLKDSLFQVRGYLPTCWLWTGDQEGRCAETPLSFNMGLPTALFVQGLLAKAGDGRWSVVTGAILLRPGAGTYEDGADRAEHGWLECDDWILDLCSDRGRWGPLVLDQKPDRRYIPGRNGPSAEVMKNAVGKVRQWRGEAIPQSIADSSHFQRMARAYREMESVFVREWARLHAISHMAA